MQIADVLDVSISCVNNWKVQHPEFAQALRVGKDEVDEAVARSLLGRALGYTYDSVKIFCKDGEVTEVPYREHVPPDVTAQIFWLKNRRPNEWRDRHEVSGPSGGALEFTLKVGSVSADGSRIATEVGIRQAVGVREAAEGDI